MVLLNRYDFNSNSVNGQNLYNYAYDRYDAQLINYPTINNQGPTDTLKSVSFHSNARQYININPYKSANNGMSFACWFKSDPINQTWSRIFDFGNGPGQNNIIMFINNGSIGLSVYASQVYQPYNIIPNVNNNQWYHVIWTLSNPSGWNIYVNGVLSKTILNVRLS